MPTWRIVPTSRRTSKADRVDILDERGRFVAGYVQRADALRMIHDPVSIAEDAINLYVEGLDRRDDDHEAARAYAMEEIHDAVNADVDALYDELAGEAAERRRQPENQPSPDDDEGLPY